MITIFHSRSGYRVNSNGYERADHEYGLKTPIFKNFEGAPGISKF